MIKIPHSAGVYCLKALNSKLIYIGSTKNLARRKAVHLYSIKKNLIDKGCKPMIDAYHNGDYVNFEVIEICDNYLEREQYWLDHYKNEGTNKVVNAFDADRNGSLVSSEFRDKMSDIRKNKWKDENYREKALGKMKATMFSPERLNKPVHQFTKKGEYVKLHESGKKAAEELNLNSVSVCAAARGSFHKKFTYKEWIFVQDGVLNKLDELLETHQELRAISSQAWEICKSNTKVQRLIGEQDKQ